MKRLSTRPLLALATVLAGNGNISGQSMQSSIQRRRRRTIKRGCLQVVAAMAALLWPLAAWAQNSLPVGTHDGELGMQPAGSCMASGWAADPDDRATDLQVRVLSDGAVIAQTIANRFRPDLLVAGVCLDGTCSFELNLFSLVSSDVNHSIRVQAQDAQTGEWADLQSTPKTLNCSGSPEGFHDGSQDGQHNFNCTASGWAVDPNDRNADLEVRVLSDGEIVAKTVANRFRGDLEQAGVCPGGTCSFNILLWGRIKKGAEHSITVQAKDAQTGKWTNLSNSPKMLRCFNFNLTVFDLEEGKAKLVTDLPDVGQFVPSWSPDGKKIAHTMVGWKRFDTDFICDIYITDVKQGITTPLPGADGGSNAVYSPDGETIAFDRSCAGDSSLYIMPARGGARQMVRTDAVSPDWSPDGKRLVFQQPSNGSLRTADVSGGEETLIGFGVSPAWSPDGKWIAFNTDDVGDIWKVRVDRSGNAVGPSIQLTTDPTFEKQPAWSRDGDTIFFQSELAEHFDPLNEEFRMWAISASGDNRRELTGQTGMGVDLSSSRKRNALAYGGYQSAERRQRDGVEQ